MNFLVYRDKAAYRLAPAQGPQRGVEIATAEQLQLARFETHPNLDAGLLALGEIVATWGLMMSDSFDLNAEMVRALGVNRAFRTLPGGWEAPVRDGPTGGYIADPAGGILNVTGQILHLYPNRAVYVR